MFKGNGLAPAKRLLDYMESKRADAGWYLRILATLVSKGVDTDIFAKDFVYVPTRKRKVLQKPPAKANPRQCSMLAGLPKLTVK